MDEKKAYEPILDIEDVLAILNKISIFAGLSDAQLYTLFRLLNKVTFKSNETFFEQGDQPNYIYLVKKGNNTNNCYDITYNLYNFIIFGQSRYHPRTKLKNSLKYREYTNTGHSRNWSLRKLAGNNTLNFISLGNP